MPPDFQRRLSQGFDLTPSMATWMLVTHFFVLACPLALIWVVTDYGSLLPTPLAHPLLVLIGSAVYLGATAFEVAQNAADRWYLTAVTASVTELFFNGFLTLAFCLYTIGFVGLGWPAALALVLTALYPFAYIANHVAHRAISGAVVLIGTLALYRVTGDPLVFFFLVGTGVGVYLVTFLMKRLAQWLHGLAALVFGLAFLTWPLALVNAAHGTPMSWTTFGVGVAGTGAVMGALFPLLSRARATPRPGGMSHPAQSSK